ncbi:MAG TPA: hypothetical protein VM934_15320 [Pyrinomonadaceae bacterium]|jgi:hypothetical protein|nr:hypothetical protein [Pyrinomonadaceae bacterium]
MENRRGDRRRSYERQMIFKLGLLMLPALFWSAIFAALAGVRPLERFTGTMPDAEQVALAAGCLLLALVLGWTTIRQDGHGRRREPKPSGRIKVATGVLIVVFAVAASF